MSDKTQEHIIIPQLQRSFKHTNQIFAGGQFSQKSYILQNNAQNLYPIYFIHTLFHVCDFYAWVSIEKKRQYFPMVNSQFNANYFETKKLNDKLT